MTLTKDEAALVIRCLREAVRSRRDLMKDYGYRMPYQAIEHFESDVATAEKLANDMDFERSLRAGMIEVSNCR